MPADAKLEELDGRPALRFERVLPHPPQRVWRALTEPEEMFAWHPTPARFEPRAGGRVDYDSKGHIAGMEDGEVTAYEEPRLLAYTWGVEEGQQPDHLRWELSPHDDGCLLVLVHSFSDCFKAARDGAGWHVCLDSLASLLEGRAEPPGSDPNVPGPWERLNAHLPGEIRDLARGGDAATLARLSKPAQLFPLCGKKCVRYQWTWPSSTVSVRPPTQITPSSS